MVPDDCRYCRAGHPAAEAPEDPLQAEIPFKQQALLLLKSVVMKTKMKFVLVSLMPRTWIEAPSDADETIIKAKYLKLKQERDTKSNKLQRFTGRDYLTSH